MKTLREVSCGETVTVKKLSPYTLEEVVARNYLISESPDVIINIVDGTNIERNLYLSTQLMELGIPVVMAVNMIDLVNKNSDKISLDKLSKSLECEVVEISALKGTGIQEAADKAVALAGKKAQAVVHKFDERVEDAIAAVSAKLPIIALIAGAFFDNSGAIAWSAFLIGIAAMGAIKREMNNAKWFWFAIGYQCMLAYIVALCIYQIGTLITVGTFGIGTAAAFILVLGFLYLLFRPYRDASTLRVDTTKLAKAAK